VGPVDQYPRLVRLVSERGLDCSEVMFVAMDEYLGDDGRWIDPEHPLSFRGYLRRAWLEALPRSAGFLEEHLRFPEPEGQEGIARWLDARGGADVAFAGIGLNGHLACNEPEGVPADEFGGRPARVVRLAEASRAHAAVNVGCALELVPRTAVTVGMADIL